MYEVRKSLDIQKKEVTGVISVNSLDFVNTIFDCFNNNQIVVFLSSETDRYKIEATGVTHIIKPKSEFGWFDAKFIPKPPESISQISFTSGTTGQPKGVILNHRALNDVVDRLIYIMEIDSSIREYVGVPVNYSFGFGRCRVVATVGGQFYIPENGFNPLEIRDMLLEGSINAISAVPSLWRTLFECEEIFGEETKAVKWIEIGSQYMSKAEKEQIRRIFPQAKIVQHYGLTEASRSTFLRIDQTQGKHLESVGKPYGKTEIRISADNKITIKGPHVAEHLLIAGQTQKNIDENGWHETNDLGEIKDGYVYYLGRADDLINCGGIKVSPDNIEKDIRDILNIQSGIAVTRVNDSVRGEAILVGMLKSAGLNRKVVKNAAFLAATRQNIQSVDAIKVMEFAEFPATATGKIQRKQLTKLYAEKIESLQAAQDIHVNESTENEPDSPLTDGEKEIITVWKSVLDVKHIEVDSNFFELGGDSLTAISVMVKMEKLGISKQIVQGMLQGLSVRELAERMESFQDSEQTSHTISNHYAKTGMTINIVRGLLVLCVISGHWSGGILNRLSSIIGTVLPPLLAPIFGAGTPGFAIIYGVSAGYSMLNIFNTDRDRLNKIIYTTLGLLTGGVLILALMNLSQQLIIGQAISFTDVTNSFYSVLTYYWLITLTLPLWLTLIAKSNNPAVRAIFLSVVLYCCYYYFFAGLGVYRPEGFVELAKLMVSAKYSYINLAAGSLSGIAIGIIIRQNIKRSPMPIGFTWIGLALVAAGFVVCSHAGLSDTWLIWPGMKTALWGWFFYLGLVIISLAITNQILSGYNQLPQIAKFSLQSLSTIGILAFPLFITHKMVIPLKDIINAVGLPGSLSLIIPMSMFLVTFAFMFKKVHEVNFIWSKEK